MKRCACLLLVLAAAGPGCLNLETGNDKPRADKPAAEVSRPPAPPAVDPEQVNENNARQVLEALRAELDRASAERPVPMPKP